HVGFFTRTVEDAAIVLDALVEPATRHYHENLGRAREKFVIGIPQAYFFEDLDSEVEAKVDEAIEQCKRLASSVREVHLPVNTDRTLQSAEAYAYHRPLLASSRELYHPETVRRICSGEKVTAEQYQESLVRLAQMREEIVRASQGIDAVLMPTVPL